MDNFWGGGLTYIPNVPITAISEVLEERIRDFESNPPKYMLESEPQLSSTYLEFNMQTPVLKNKKVRQAINYAVNRKKLVEKIMRNQAYEIGKFGITPPLTRIFNEYDFEGIEDTSYTFNPERAKELLAEAGYPGGKNFPSLSMQFRLGNDTYLIASEIQNQLKSVLNINIQIEGVEFNQLIENQAMGKADIFRSTWFGDYPNPETFLVNAYGKIVPASMDEPSYMNSSRYVNPAFDEAFERGSKSVTQEESYAAFAEAEKILMADAAFIMLWYGEDMMLLQSKVRDLETNGMRFLDLRSVYFKTRTAKETEKEGSES
jgi:oligopeptide transport system substrate-binding protein